MCVEVDIRNEAGKNMVNRKMVKMIKTSDEYDLITKIFLPTT